jgi:hypothetical protein
MQVKYPESHSVVKGGYVMLTLWPQDEIFGHLVERADSPTPSQV